jgi:hypothetical protein
MAKDAQRSHHLPDRTIRKGCGILTDPREPQHHKRREEKVEDSLWMEKVEDTLQMTIKAGLKPGLSPH